MSRTSILALLAAVSACIPATGRLDSNRFQHRSYPYAVFYVDNGRADAPLGPEWKVENFRFPDRKHMYPKADVGYTTLRGYDSNRDGKRDFTREELFYDLLLAHTRPHGAMWIRSVPLSHADAGLGASELAQRYVAAAIEQGRVAAAFGTEIDALPGRSSAGSGAACELSKHEAYRVDFELPADPKGTARPRPARAGSVVVVKTSYLADQGQPVALLIGLSSAPEYAAEFDRDFDRLLGRTVLGELHAGLSMKGGSTCTRSAAPPASAAAGEVPAPDDNTQGDAWELAPADALPAEPGASTPDATAPGGATDTAAPNTESSGGESVLPSNEVPAEQGV